LLALLALKLLAAARASAATLEQSKSRTATQVKTSNRARRRTTPARGIQVQRESAPAAQRQKNKLRLVAQAYDLEIGAGPPPGQTAEPAIAPAIRFFSLVNAPLARPVIDPLRLELRGARPRSLVEVFAQEATARVVAPPTGEAGDLRAAVARAHHFAPVTRFQTGDTYAPMAIEGLPSFPVGARLLAIVTDPEGRKQYVQANVEQQRERKAALH
jgi:hypothetical protein